MRKISKNLEENVNTCGVNINKNEYVKVFPYTIMTDRMATFQFIHKIIYYIGIMLE